MNGRRTAAGAVWALLIGLGVTAVATPSAVAAECGTIRTATVKLEARAAAYDVRTVIFDSGVVDTDPPEYFVGPKFVDAVELKVYICSPSGSTPYVYDIVVVNPPSALASRQRDLTFSINPNGTQTVANAGYGLFFTGATRTALDFDAVKCTTSPRSASDFARSSAARLLTRLAQRAPSAPLRVLASFLSTVQTFALPAAPTGTAYCASMGAMSIPYTIASDGTLRTQMPSSGVVRRSWTESIYYATAGPGIRSNSIATYSSVAVAHTGTSYSDAAAFPPSPTSSGAPPQPVLPPAPGSGGTPVPTLPPSIDEMTRAHDLTGDGNADLLGRNAGDGTLTLFPGDGAGGFAAPVGLGSGWGPFGIVLTPGDFDGDGRSDVIARKSDGTLWMWPGRASGVLGAGSQIGHGWGSFTAILAPGDFSGDGKPDLIARDSGGYLLLYRGNGAGGFQAGSTRIGNGWAGFTAIVAPGDFSGDGKPDLIARDTDGRLVLFRGNGAGGFASPYPQIGNGWAGFTAIVGPGDFDGDGKPDLVARSGEGYGDLILYRGNGAGGFISPYPQIGNGWSIFATIV